MAKDKNNLQDVSEVIRHKTPVKETCRRCKGDGKIKNPMYIDGQPCPECGGEGEARYVK